MRRPASLLLALTSLALGPGCAPPPAPVAKVSVSATPPARCEERVSPAQKLIAEGDRVRAMDLDGAISLYEKAAGLDPDSYQTAFKLGMAYRKKEAWEKAGEALSRATKLRPADADGWYLRGLTLAELAKKKAGSWAEARESFQRCVEVDPNFAACHAQLGKALLYLDDEQGALESYTRAILRDPKRMVYYALLADTYLALDLAGDAEVVLREALKRGAPDDKELYGIHVLLARVYQDRGALAEMVGELEAARAVAGPDSQEALEILFNLGSTYAQLQPPRKLEALQMLKSFFARACKGTKAQTYKLQCDTAEALITQLGGALP